MHTANETVPAISAMARLGVLSTKAVDAFLQTLIDETDPAVQLEMVRAAVQLGVTTEQVGHYSIFYYSYYLLLPGICCCRVFAAARYLHGW